jgi:hypothetical protein
LPLVDFDTWTNTRKLLVYLKSACFARIRDYSQVASPQKSRGARYFALWRDFHNHYRLACMKYVREQHPNSEYNLPAFFFGKKKDQKVVEGIMAETRKGHSASTLYFADDNWTFKTWLTPKRADLQADLATLKEYTEKSLCWDKPEKPFEIQVALRNSSEDFELEMTYVLK